MLVTGYNLDHADHYDLYVRLYPMQLISTADVAECLRAAAIWPALLEISPCLTKKKTRTTEIPLKNATM